MGFFTVAFCFLAAGLFFLWYLLGGAGEASTILPSVDSAMGISCFPCLRCLPRSLLREAASVLSSAVLVFIGETSPSIFAGSGGSTILSAAAKEDISFVSLTMLTARVGLSPVELTADVFFRVVLGSSLFGMLARLWFLTSGWNRLGIVERRVLRLLGNCSVELILDLDLDSGSVFLVT